MWRCTRKSKKQGLVVKSSDPPLNLVKERLGQDPGQRRPECSRTPYRASPVPTPRAQTTRPAGRGRAGSPTPAGSREPEVRDLRGAGAGPRGSPLPTTVRIRLPGPPRKPGRARVPRGRKPGRRSTGNAGGWKYILSFVGGPLQCMAKGMDPGNGEEFILSQCVQPVLQN